MKYLLLSCALLCAGVSFSQSKKKQIELLENQIDSITKVNLEIQTQNVEAIELLRKENEVLREIMKGYVVLIDQLNTKNLELEQKNANLERENSQSEAKIDLKKEEPKPKNSTNRRNRNTFPAEERGMGGTGSDSNSPFGGEGGFGQDSGFGQGSGEGTGQGSGIGLGSGTGIQNDHRRVRLNNVDIQNIEVAKDATINYQLTVDAVGNVLAFSLAGIRDMSLDQALVNKVGAAIKKQVKYNKAKGSPMVYQYYTIHIEAN